MTVKVFRTSLTLAFLCIANIISAQNKLTRNQILNAVRHHTSTDTTTVSLNNAVICDSTTNKITLEALNDTITQNYSYLLTFTPKDIELVIFSQKYNLYKSIFEYENLSFKELIDAINKRHLKKIDFHNDSLCSKGNYTLKLYKNNNLYISMESYNMRTNVTTGFHEIVSKIRKNLPNFSYIMDFCKTANIGCDSLQSDTNYAAIIPNTESVTFKSKGGEFKKIKISCNEEDWELLSYPEWISISRNKNNEIVVESTKNETKRLRTGFIKVGCLGGTKEILISQKGRSTN